jgi:hypothetical protein
MLRFQGLIFLSIPTFGFVRDRAVSFRMNRHRSFDRRESLFDRALALEKSFETLVVSRLL